jgi:hypothetical protein
MHGFTIDARRRRVKDAGKQTEPCGAQVWFVGHDEDVVEEDPQGISQWRGAGDPVRKRSSSV